MSVEQTAFLRGVLTEDGALLG